MSKLKVALCLHGKFDSLTDSTSKGKDGFDHIKKRIFAKVTPDVLYIVTNCVLEFTKQNKDLTFSTKDIWESKFANDEIKNIFNLHYFI